MKVSLIGGSGFLGSNLAFALKKAGHLLKIIDIQKPSSELAGVEFVKCDIRSEKLASHLKSSDVVINLAAITNVQATIDDPKTAFDVNFNGTVNALEATLSAAPGAFFLQVGTGMVYKPNVEPVGESAVLDPKSPFAASKLAADLAVISYFHSKFMPACVIRPFNVYGPWQSSGNGNVVATFAARSIKGDALQIRGSGKQERDFVYVEDVCRAIEAVISHRDASKGVVFNIGSGTSTSILQLAKLFSGKVEMVGHDHPQSDVACLVSDNSLATKSLGWKPQVDLKKGIALTVNWFKNRG